MEISDFTVIIVRTEKLKNKLGNWGVNWDFSRNTRPNLIFRLTTLLLPLPAPSIYYTIEHRRMSNSNTEVKSWLFSDSLTNELELIFITSHISLRPLYGAVQK